MGEDLSRQAEDAGLHASASPEQMWLDGWLIRRCAGKAKRSRCINAVAPARQPLQDKLSACAALYRNAGLPLLMRMTPFSVPAQLDRELADRGWSRFDDTRVMMLPHLPPRPPADSLDACGSLGGITAQPASPAAFARAIGRLRQSPAGQVSAHEQRLAASCLPCTRVLWHRDGELVACGQSVHQQAWVGLYDICVAPALRSRGLGRALCASLMLEARQRGAISAYLQVDAGNAPARAIYHRLGFADAYAYHYRSPDARAG